MENFTMKTLLKDILNCWLRYVLAQPVNIDVHILYFFLLQYVGLPKIIAAKEAIIQYLSEQITRPDTNSEAELQLTTAEAAC